MSDICSRPTYDTVSDGASYPRILARILLDQVRYVERRNCTRLKASYVGQNLVFFLFSSVMPYAEKAGNSLPQDCANLEQFIRAQAHIRAAAQIVDDLSVIKPPQLSKEQLDKFRKLASEVTDILWEADSDVQALLSSFYLPIFPA